ncbi:MAG: PEP-CTERM sorting domain-containing protein [bacterium]|nr:PEP-CTERM sorting domain-containing protein [bacterium]MCP5068491.1 PEP-CTERM sorting domain-containing protein [bacterium]
MPRAHSIRFLLLVLAAILITQPASAVVLRVEWEGFATEHNRRTGSGGGVDAINIPVLGLFEMDLAPLVLDPGEYGDGSGGYDWGASPQITTWSIAFDGPATAEQIEDIDSFQATCNASCDIDWVGNDPSTFFLFDGADDPEDGQLDLGTGQWWAGGGWAIDVFGNLRGTVTSSTVSVIPEPGIALLLGIGLVGLGVGRRRLR